MTHEVWADIFAHQLKGIMFHADAYGVACLHGYKRMKMSHRRAATTETGNFMCVRRKAIEALGEITDIPPVTRIEVPHDASEEDLAEMWLKWETEAAEVYAKALAEEPTCKMWAELHKCASDEMRYIVKMYL